MVNRLSNNVMDIFETINKHRPFKGNLVVWLGLRASDYSMIRFIDPNMVVSTRYGKDTINIENKLSMVSAEKHTKTRTDSHMEELDPYIPDFLKFLASLEDVSANLVCYYSTPKLEELVSKYPNIHILNPPHSLKSYLDQKTVVTRQLKELGVKCIPGVEGAFSQEMFDPIARKYDLPFVVRFDESSAGFGVYLINSHADFMDLLPQNLGKPTTFMKYIDGKSLNINAVRTYNFVVFSEPSFQIIGPKECTINEFGYCGNDFNIGSKISDEQLQSIFSITQKVGDWLGNLGYYGMFGLDLLADEKDVYFTEINPRFQGSTSTLVDRQIEIGKIPLSFFHLVPYLDGLSLNEDFVDGYNTVQSPLDVSQILLKNITGTDCIVESSLVPGRYNLEDDRLRYLGPGQFLSDTTAYDEIVITGDIPVNGTKVLKFSDEIVKIASYKEVLDRDGRNLNPFGRKLVKLVYSTFKFTPNGT